MSRRNEAVNRIVQSSHMANEMPAFQRKVLVHLLNAAYAAGRTEVRTATRPLLPVIEAYANEYGLDNDEAKALTELKL